MKICLIPRNPVLFPPFSGNGWLKPAALHLAGDGPCSSVWQHSSCSHTLWAFLESRMALPSTAENPNSNVLSVEMAQQFPHHALVPCLKLRCFLPTQ